VVCNFLTGGVGERPMPAYPNPAITLTTIHKHKKKIIVFKNVCTFAWHGGSLQIL
jgi:hypothetical protein